MVQAFYIGHDVLKLSMPLAFTTNSADSGGLDIFSLPAIHPRRTVRTARAAQRADRRVRDCIRLSPIDAIPC